MPSFWSYIKNEKYAVGCTGQTVYVYDSNSVELAKFKDLKYAYTPMFSPDGKTLIVKSTEGCLAVYDLDELELIKKFRFSKVAEAQDDGFCFSNDGRLFYNIERQNNSCNSCISVYDTTDFKCVGQYYANDSKFEPSHIECDNDRLFVLGFTRNDKGVFDCGFVAMFNGEELQELRYITETDYRYYWDYKRLELSGFTAKSIEWSEIKEPDKKAKPLSELWEKQAADKQV